MKKLFIAVLAVSALTISSCGNKSASTTEAADSAQTEAVELNEATQSTYDKLIAALQEALDSKDPQALTTTLANLATTYTALVNSGKLDDALSYGQAIKDYVANNSESLKALAGDNSSISSLISTIQSLPTDASTTAEQAKEAVNSEAVSLASSALQKAAAAGVSASDAASALENLPSSAKEAVESVVSGASSSASSASTSVSDAVESAKESAKEAAKEKINEAASDAASKAASSAVKKLGL